MTLFLSSFLATTYILTRRISTKYLFFTSFLSQIQIVSFMLHLIPNSSDFEHQRAFLSESFDNVLKILACDPEVVNRVLPDTVLYITSFIYFIVILSSNVILFVWWILQKKSTSRWLETVNQYLSITHLHVLLLPILRYYTYLLTENSRIIESDLGVSRGLITNVTVILYIISIAYAAIGSVLSFHPLKTKNLLSRRFLPVEGLDFLTKLVFVITQALQTNSENISLWLCTIIALILVGIKLYIIIAHCPYYHYKVYKPLIIVTSSQISACFINLIILIIGSSHNLSVLLIWAFVFPVVSFCLLSLFDHHTSHMLSSSDRSHLAVYKKYMLYSYIFEQGSDCLKIERTGNITEEEQRFLGIVSEHRRICCKIGCFCKVISEQTSPQMTNFDDIRQSLNQYKNEFFTNLFEETIKRNPHTNWIKITLAQFIVESDITNFPLALSLVHSIPKGKQTFITQYVIKLLLEKIYQHLSHNDDFLKIAAFTKFTKAAENLKEKIFDVTKDMVDFWAHFSEPEPHFQDLSKHSTKINKKNDKLKTHWKLLKKQYGDLLLKEYPLYISYCAVIRNSEKDSYDALQEYQKLVLKLQVKSNLTKLLINEDLSNEKNIFIRTSMEKKNMGSILKASENVYESFGYTSAELKGNHLNTLFPSFLHQRPELFEQNFNCLHSQIKSDNNFGFGQNRSGFLIPYHVCFSPYPILDQEFSCLSIFRLLDSSIDYLVIDKDNTIIGMTEVISQSLSIASNEVKKRQIDQLCPEFMLIRQAFERASKLKLQGEQGPSVSSIDGSPTDAFDLISKPDHEQLLDIYESLISYGYYLDFFSAHAKSSERVQIGYMCTISEINSESQVYKILKLQKLFEKKPDPETNFLFTEAGSASKEFQDLDSLVSLKNERKRSEFSTKYGQENKSVFSKHASLKAKQMATGSEDSMAFMDIDEFNDINCENKGNNVGSLKLGNPSRILASLRMKTIAYNEGQINKHEEMSKTPIDTKTNLESKKKHIIENQPTHLAAHIAQMSQKGSSINSTSSNHKRVIYELEAAIQKKPKENFVRAVIAAMLLYFILGITSFIINNANTRSLMDESLDASKTIRIGSLRMYSLIEMARRTRCANLVERGYLPRVRLATIPDYAFFCAGAARNLSTAMLEYNDIIAGFYSELDSSLLANIFQKYELEPRRENEPKMDVFNLQAMNEFAVSAMKVQEKKKFEVPFDPEDPDMQFILKNALNSPITASEKLLDALFDHIHILSEKICSSAVSLIIVFAVFSVIFISGGTKEERGLGNLKEQLFRILLRLEEKEYQAYSQQILSFYKSQQSQKTSDQKIITLGRIGKTKKDHAKSTIARKSKYSRSGNTSGIRNGGIRRVLIATISMSPLLVGQGIFIQLMKNYKEEISEQNTQILTSDTMLARYTLLFEGLYEYISENRTTTMRNLPIASQVEKEMTYLKDSQSFFVSLREKGSEINQTIIDVLSGNGCDYVTAEVYNYTTCLTLCSGALTRGVIGTNSFLMDALSKIKDFFDLSELQEADIKASLMLQAVRDVEALIGQYYKGLYIILDAIMIEKIEDTVKQYHKKTDPIQAALIVLCIVILYTTYKFICLSYIEEKYELKRMLKIIPSRIILNNQQLKKYLKSLSKELVNLTI